MLDRLTGARIYLDTNILIYAFEPGHPGPDKFRDFFAAVDDGKIEAVTSDLTLAEVLTQPLRQGAEDMIALYEQLLSQASPIRCHAVDRAVLRRSAKLRAEKSLRLADAIHAATASETGCQYFFTEDAALGRAVAGTIPWLSLDRLATP